mmetsp:Transcript_96534/g.144458  ORF Transcript_96534/g.144458 Transcript_96534/m.144458 type:complete len:104 (-) Transcript_96534:368-679(-)
MALSDHAQCAITIMWFSVFGMIISFLLDSPWIFLFLFAFVFNCFALMKGMSAPLKGADDELDEVELQPLEMVQPPSSSTETKKKKKPFKANKEMTLGDLLNQY